MVTARLTRTGRGVGMALTGTGKGATGVGACGGSVGAAGATGNADCKVVVPVTDPVGGREDGMDGRDIGAEVVGRRS